MLGWIIESLESLTRQAGKVRTKERALPHQEKIDLCADSGKNHMTGTQRWKTVSCRAGRPEADEKLKSNKRHRQELPKWVIALTAVFSSAASASEP